MTVQRLPAQTRESLDAAQQAVWDRMASGARGGVKGPFQALITSPELCARVEQLGVFVRFECSVPMRLRELAILCVGHHWKAAYEWFAHAPIAEKQGVPAAVIAAIGRDSKKKSPSIPMRIVWWWNSCAQCCAPARRRMCFTSPCAFYWAKKARSS
jgi:4-carboxymuconolactone decarboxylase